MTPTGTCQVSPRRPRRNSDDGARHRLRGRFLEWCYSFSGQGSSEKGCALTQASTNDCYRLLSPIGMVGYGIVEQSFARGLAERPDVIGVDGGSVDPGPYYLGSGRSFTSREMVTRDLRMCLRGGNELGIPVVVGTAGGAGGEPHLAFALDCLRDAARAEGLTGLRVVTVHSEQPK